MKTNFIKLCAFGLGALTFFGCQEEEDAVMESMQTQKAYAENCDVIDFNRYPAVITPITEVHSVKGMGPVMVMNRARNGADAWVEGNRAVIFDMDNPTGDDRDDLYHPGQGKGLIVQQLANDMADQPTDVPNDNMWGGEMVLDFSKIGPVTINTMKVFDIDTYEIASYIRLYDAGGTVVKEYHLEALGNGSEQLAVLNTSNVMKMVVTLDGNGAVGSGSIDDIEFCVMPKETPPTPTMGCTRTQGYWKTHGDVNNTKKYDNTWDPYVNKTFYLSGMTYMAVLHEPTKGSAYLILAHQYIAAMLNMKAGASMPTDVKSAFDAATAYFEKNKPMKKDPMHDQLTAWASVLDDYNNGKTGPGHCD